MNRKSANVFIGVLSFAAALSTAAVFTATDAQAKKVSVKKVTASAPSGKNVYVAKGKKVKITTTVKVKPNKKANKKVTYKSANKKIATVSAKGVVKGVKPGKTKITVTSKKNKKKKTVLKVYVKKAAAKKVKINSKNFALLAGETKKLTATVTPKKNVYKKVVWTSSNKKTASVTKKGVVKGLSEGTAKITASAVDGSGEKASVTVQVGAGIASVSALNSNVVRVVLTGKKTLQTANFQVQTRSGASSTKYLAKHVESVTTNDQKTYDIKLKERLFKGEYLKVTISALTANKSVEIFVDHIVEMVENAGNTMVEYVEFNKDEKDHFNRYFGINNSNAVGRITYTSLTGLPSGLKAYISEAKTNVFVRGDFTNIERGTTAVLSGYDEKGTVFTKKFIFVVGSDTQIVTVAEPASTELAYCPDDPKTLQNESSGCEIHPLNIRDKVHVAGGSGEYDYNWTYNGKSLDELRYGEDNKEAAINPGTYAFNVEITDNKNTSLKANATVTFHFVAGITVSGKVVDAAGCPVKYEYVTGFTKKDEYGRYGEFSAMTEKDGTYVARVLPGDYCAYVKNFSDNRNFFDFSYENKFHANTVKNFEIPAYKVNITTNIAGAAGYSVYNFYVIDSYGERYSVSNYRNEYDADRSMYAYLPAGNYEVLPYYQGINYNEIAAYGKIEESTDGIFKKYYLSDALGTYKVSGNFTVSGNNTVVLNAEKKVLVVK